MFVRLFDTVERLYVKKCIGDMFARAIVASLTRTKGRVHFGARFQNKKSLEVDIPSSVFCRRNWLSFILK